ncbi:hypothetical protein TWF281_000253 [Arthrobotrys megalospora]
MQQIKRKPVPNRHLQPLETQERVPKNSTFEADISPTHPLTQTRKDTQYGGPLKTSPTWAPAENVDGVDFKAFLLKANQLSIEHQPLDDMIKADRETFSPGSTKHHDFDNTTSEPPKQSENIHNGAGLTLLSGTNENNALGGRGSASDNTAKTTSEIADVQSRGQGESRSGNRDSTAQFGIETTGLASVVREYIEIPVQLCRNPLEEAYEVIEYQTGFLLSPATIMQALNAHDDLMARTGSYVDNLSPTSVGPISRMLRDWFNHHTEEDIYGFQKPPFDGVAEDVGYWALKELLENNPHNHQQRTIPSSDAGVYNYMTQSWGETWEWKRLFELFVWSNCICAHLFSSSSSECLLACWGLIQSYVSVEAKDCKRIIKYLTTALEAELDHASTNCWVFKATAMLKDHDLKGADDILQLAFINSKPEDCGKIRDAILVENWRRFVAGIWTPLYPPTSPEEGFIYSLSTYSLRYQEYDDSNIAAFFQTLRSYERPETRRREAIEKYTYDRGPNKTSDGLPTFQIREEGPLAAGQTSSYDFDLKRLSQPQLDQYKTLVSRRSVATKGDQYSKVIAEVDDLLLSFYPGIEELKRWLSTKAYLLVTLKKWQEASKIMKILGEEPLHINDDLNSVFNLTLAMIQIRDQEYSAAEMSCYKALQYSGIPECDRDEIYYVLSTAVRLMGRSREADEYLLRMRTKSVQTMEDRFVYGIVLPEQVEAAGIHVTWEGRFTAPPEIFQKAMVSALRNPELALALFSDIYWIIDLPVQLNEGSNSISSLSFLSPHPQLPEGYDPIYFYCKQNRADILEIILTSYRSRGLFPQSLASVKLAGEVLTQAFQHAAGDTVSFLVKTIPDLNINDVLLDESRRRYTRFHHFIGRRPYPSSTEASLKFQEEVGWGVQIKRGLNLGQIKEFLDTLKQLGINPNIPYGSISTMESTVMSVEQCYDRFILVAGAPQSSNFTLAKHDLLVAYYCYTWLFTLPGLKHKSNGRTLKIMDKVNGGLRKHNIEPVWYPRIGTEVAPYSDLLSLSYPKRENTTSSPSYETAEISMSQNITVKRESEVSTGGPQPGLPDDVEQINSTIQSLANRPKIQLRNPFDIFRGQGK